MCTIGKIATTEERIQKCNVTTVTTVKIQAIISKSSHGRFLNRDAMPQSVFSSYYAVFL